MRLYKSCTCTSHRIAWPFSPRALCAQQLQSNLRWVYSSRYVPASLLARTKPRTDGDDIFRRAPSHCPSRMRPLEVVLAFYVMGECSFNGTGICSWPSLNVTDPRSRPSRWQACKVYTRGLRPCTACHEVLHAPNNTAYVPHGTADGLKNPYLRYTSGVLSNYRASCARVEGRRCRALGSAR